MARDPNWKVKKARTWPVRRWFFKMARLIMGVSNWLDRQTKRTSPKNPITSQPRTEKLKKHDQKDRESLKSSLKMKQLIARRLMISSVSRLTVLICSMERRPATSEARRIGNWTKKMDRQPKLAVKRPPTVGPMAGAMAVIRSPLPSWDQSYDLAPAPKWC